MCNVLIYCRVSTKDQDASRQKEELESAASLRNWTVSKIVSEVVSGRSEIASRKIGRVIRKEFKAFSIDKILITEISRLGRRVSDAVNFIEYLNGNGVSLYIHNLGMETLQESGKVNHMFKPILVTLASFAEMERDLLSERVKSGLEAAKRKGKTLGRPKGSRKPKVDYLREYSRLIEDIRIGLSLRKLSKIHGVSINTIRKVKSVMDDPYQNKGKNRTSSYQSV